MMALRSYAVFGEHGIYAVGPAVFCAIENALDARLDAFPATPERTLRALRLGRGEH